MKKPTSTSSPASAASPSPLPGRDSAPSPSAKSIPFARKSSRAVSGPSPNTIGAKLHSREAPLPDCAGITTTPLRLDGCASQPEGGSQSEGLLPTPRAGKHSPQSREDFTPNLAARIEGLLPTPATRDYKGANGPDHLANGTGRLHLDQLPNALRFSSPTSAPSTAPDSEAQLSLPGASPASLSASPGNERARMILATSGRKCSELFRKPGPLGSLVRTLAESSTWNSSKCVLTWKAKAMKSSRLLFQLVPSTPRTGGTGFGLLLTVSTEDHKSDVPKALEKWSEAAKLGKRPCTSAQRLRNQIATLPTFAATPASWDCQGSTGGGQGRSLRTDIAMLPTPHGEERNPGPNGGHVTSVIKRLGQVGQSQQEALNAVSTSSLLPTPDSVPDSEASHNQASGQFRAGMDKALGTRPGLKLQPAFVEWMMGYPEGWTDLKPSGTASSPKSHTRSSGKLRR